MDRSFLSQSAVIAASRDFVCARLATYEDAEEGSFMKSLLRTRSGELENSVFCIFAPDGQEKLVRGARSMNGTYSNADEMATGMKKITAKYKPKEELSGVPLVPNFRLALDVASADSQPLVVIVAKGAEKRKEAEKAMSKLVWNADYVGRFVTTINDDVKLEGIEGVKESSTLLLIQPDKFGQKGKVLAQTAQVDAWKETLTTGLKDFVREEKSFQSHVQEGKTQGVFWETKIPVTDPMELKARERGRKK